MIKVIVCGALGALLVLFIWWTGQGVWWLGRRDPPQKKKGPQS